MPPIRLSVDVIERPTTVKRPRRLDSPWEGGEVRSAAPPRGGPDRRRIPSTIWYQATSRGRERGTQVLRASDCKSTTQPRRPWGEAAPEWCGRATFPPEPDSSPRRRRRKPSACPSWSQLGPDAAPAHRQHSGATHGTPSILAGRRQCLDLPSELRPRRLIETAVAVWPRQVPWPVGATTLWVRADTPAHVALSISQRG